MGFGVLGNAHFKTRKVGSGGGPFESILVLEGLDRPFPAVPFSGPGPLGGVAQDGGVLGRQLPHRLLPALLDSPEDPRAGRLGGASSELLGGMNWNNYNQKQPAHRKHRFQLTFLFPFGILSCEEFIWVPST